MTDLKSLDELGRTLDPPAPTPPGRLRHRVLTEATRPARGRWRFTTPRFGWRLAAVGGLAAALTVGVLATQVVSFGDRTPASTASAADRILAGAADQARHRPALTVRGDQFVYVESRTVTMSVREGGPGRATISPALRRIWLSVDGTRDGLLRERGDSVTGREDMILPGCQDGTSTYRKYGKPVQVECTPTPGYHADLPTDADGMLAYLYRGADATKNPRDQEAFTAAGDLIREAYLSPASLAAVFEAVARIPGVRVVGDVTDAAGRAGVALARDEVQGVRAELIFDRKTYAFLGEHEMLTQGAYGLKAGKSINSTAVLKVAVVDRAGQLP
ncbi:CU044_5270 family protein [Micromonospora sp. NPDC005806]|uniref:CU044_5270 family protein n=1 Tax=Micromonospora sp. NPDC005806 TaxID=3364234 RepID=UPI0036B4938A